MGLVLFVSLLLMYVQKCPLSTASFFLVVFSHSFVSEKQPAVTGALALDSGLALACLYYVTFVSLLCQVASLCLSFFIKWSLESTCFMGLLLINCAVRQNLWSLRISRRITGSSAAGQSGVGLGEKHEHFRQKTT